MKTFVSEQPKGYVTYLTTSLSMNESGVFHILLLDKNTEVTMSLIVETNIRWPT